ncbi:MAG: hypothetical protein ISP90_06205 [Nevskia sp.]|nr:hypothetical protein [Nevskia sp.]
MKKILLLACCALLGACADNPTEVNLVPQGIARAPRALNMSLKSIAVATANPSIVLDPVVSQQWHDGIQSAAEQAQIFNPGGAHSVNLVATVKRFAYSSDPFANKMEVETSYDLVDSGSGDRLLQASISSSSSDDSGTNDRNHMVALWNSATQENITRFIAVLRDKAAQGSPP